MTRYVTDFFATKEDLTFLLRKVESMRRLQYVLVGLFEAPAIVQTESLLSDPGLGVVQMGDSNLSPSYLVADRGVSVEIRSVPQRRGGIRYAVDQAVNPMTALFQPSGVFQDGCLIAGQARTTSSDPISIGLYSLFMKEIRRHFTKVKTYYVGEQASDLLDKGWRLTASVKAPVLYDLKRD